MARREMAVVGIQSEMIGNLRVPRLILVIVCAALAISIVVGLWMAGALVSAGWWGGFWANLVSDFVVGILLALGFGVFLDRYLRLRAGREQAKLRRMKVLQLLRTELQVNKTRIDEVLESLKSRGLIYPPPFWDDAWRLVNSGPLVEAIEAELLGLMMIIYSSLAGANRMVEAMWQADLVPESYEFPRPMGWPDKADEMRKAIVERCGRLKPVVDCALQRLNAQLFENSGTKRGQ